MSTAIRNNQEYPRLEDKVIRTAPRDGWQYANGVYELHKLTVSRETSLDIDGLEYLKRDLPRLIGDAVLEKGLFESRKYSQPSMYYHGPSEVVSLDVYVMKPPTGNYKNIQHVNMDGPVFVVNGVEFTNEDLVKAVKRTFPEKLI